jgi:2-C-methyl-D-erythritol 4-phosphate cytidylyltransferase
VTSGPRPAKGLSASVVLVAAGSGRRFGAARPKQFLPLMGKPLLYWPLRAFQKTPSVREVVLVLSSDSLDWGRRFVRREKLHKVKAVVAGGAERADSVRNGVAAASPDADVVLIHDAARALVTPDIISRVAEAARRSGAALAAWPVPDTLKLARGGAAPRVRRTMPRDGVWLAQTPQGFRRDVARKLYAKRAPAATDDVQLAERAGVPVALVAAAPSNFKVTRPEDFDLCRALLRP